MSVRDDGSVILPAAVKAKIKAGNDALATLTNAPEQLPPPVQPPPQPVQQVVEAKGEDQPTHPTPAYLRTTEPVVPQQDQQSADTPVPTDEASQLQEQLRLAEQRLRTMDGRRQAEVRRANEQTQTLQNQVNTLTAQIAELTNKIMSNSHDTGSGKKVLTGPRSLSSITQKEVEDYGPAFVDMVARAAEEVAQGIVAERMAQIQTRTEEISSRLDTSDRAAHLTKEQRRNKWLDANVPGWQAINESQDFVDWLWQEDTYSGIERMSILKRAMDGENFDRIKSIFEGFVKELGVTTPSRVPVGATQTVNPKTLVVPKNGGGGRVDAIVPNAPEPPLTGAEVDAYFARKIRNPKSLSEDEITRMEARIKRCLANGNYIGQPRV
jgi:hypothetical protein